MSDPISEAVQSGFDEGELIVSWALVAEVLTSDGRRYLAHRAGDVSGNGPMVWSALGMLEAGVQVARDQLRDCTAPSDE